MSYVKFYINLWIEAVNNYFFYIKNIKNIKTVLGRKGYFNIKSFNLFKWHHNLFLFTGYNESKSKVFIKLTKEKTLLKNERRVYKKLTQHTFLKNHIIHKDRYIKEGGYRILVLSYAQGVVLSEDWLLENTDKLGVLVKIVDEFNSMSLIHRDIKLDNFIYDGGQIRIFDFTFMIEKSNKTKLKELDLSNRENILKLMDLGHNYKPKPLTWDDYYSLYVIFNKLLINKSSNLTVEDKKILTTYKEECYTKIGTNSYSILK